MAKVTRRAGGARVQLRDNEVAVVTHLIDELAQLLAGDSDERESIDETPADPASDSLLTDVLVGLHWPATEPVDAPADPALKRLLPDAYRDDPEASAEFRRYTDDALREGMGSDIEVVRVGLATLADHGQLVLDDDDAQAWLRVLNRLRLVLATRLEIETASDHEALAGLDADDPRTVVVFLFDWLGYVLSDLLRALHRGGH